MSLVSDPESLINIANSQEGRHLEAVERLKEGLEKVTSILNKNKKPPEPPLPHEGKRKHSSALELIMCQKDLKWRDELDMANKAFPKDIVEALEECLQEFTKSSLGPWSRLKLEEHHVKAEDHVQEKKDFVDNFMGVET